MKNIAILGSTGSIGTQTLEVIRNNKDEFNVCALTANSNIDILYNQVLEFNPDIVVISDYNKYKEFKAIITSYNKNLQVLYGEDGLDYAASYENIDIVVSALVGIAGLKPTYSAIEKGKTIALANKETLVTAGRIITNRAKEFNAKIIPVDSEHSAIFQCIGRDREFVSKIILTASGGPFRKKTPEELKKVSFSDALKHPSWNMGKKVTIDSSTLMNKGLEVIEAKWLFDMDWNNIQVYVHPESIVHSMVEFVDGAILAQLGVPDMRIPIKYALTYPKRTVTQDNKLDFDNINSLNFEKPDTNRFPCLKLAYEALKDGDSSCIVLNGANEAAVNLFLQGEIGFMEIYNIVAKSLERHIKTQVNNIEDVFQIDNWSRNMVMELYKKR